MAISGIYAAESGETQFPFCCFVPNRLDAGNFVCFMISSMLVEKTSNSCELPNDLILALHQSHKSQYLLHGFVPVYTQKY